MQKKHITWVASILTLFVLVVVPTIALAQINTGINFLTTTGLGSRDIRSIVGSVINVLMGFLGTIAVVIVLMGGFKWMTAAGNEDKVGEAKTMIMQGVIGLAIVLAAYSIATFVVLGLLNATS